MTEEIKEILDYIDDRIIPNEHWNKVKDYITNLQQEKEEYKEIFNLMAKFRDKALERELIYKSRCEKAIEYCSLSTILSAKDLLNILNGSDENE